MVYRRTITRFIADGKVVYQPVRRKMLLTSDNSWTWRRLTYLSWRTGEIFCAHLNGEWQFHAKSHKLIGAFLACPLDWAQGPPLLRAERGLPLPVSQTIVPVLRILFSRLSMLPSFYPCQGIHSTAFVHHTALTDRENFNQNYKFPQNFHDVV